MLCAKPKQNIRYCCSRATSCTACVSVTQCSSVHIVREKVRTNEGLCACRKEISLRVRVDGQQLRMQCVCVCAIPNPSLSTPSRLPAALIDTCTSAHHTTVSAQGLTITTTTTHVHRQAHAKDLLLHPTETHLPFGTPRSLLSRC